MNKIMIKIEKNGGVMKNFKIKVKRDKTQEKTAWFMSFPALAVLTAFFVLPFILAIFYSFTNKPLLAGKNFDLQFVGLKNYHTLFTDKLFYQSLWNNIKFAAIVVPVQGSLALLLAVLVNKKSKIINMFRVIYFTPVVVTMVVVSIIWALLLAPGSEGLINAFLERITFGLFEPRAWLQDKNTALIAIVIFSVWQGVGFQMIIFLGGLQSIPGTLYEAAEIDGANKIQQFFNITVPMLKNTIIFTVISMTIFSFKLFTQVFVLTNGGPQGSTTAVVYMLYKEGFVNKKVGYSSAIAVVFFLIVLGISLLQKHLISKQEA